MNTKTKSMISCGRVKLFTKDGRLLLTKRYYTKEKRKAIIDDWVDAFGDRSGCYYHILPLIHVREKYLK